MSFPQIEKGWFSQLELEFKKSYFFKLTEFVSSEYRDFKVFPPEDKLFAAFNFTPWDEVKVVILGQDPYHGLGQAQGLSFSVPDGVKLPPSLINIFKELESDVSKEFPKSGNLECWARQGVLLLNATLSVREGKAGSHQKKGWETFTDKVIEKISKEKSGVVFLLWGNYAIKKRLLIDESKHYVLTAPHPSPLSAYQGFLGCRHFSKTNELLLLQGLQPIVW